jgi:hypothetical protein
MYYEEKVIHGVLCHRGTRDGNWIPFTIAELTIKYEGVRYAAFSTACDIENYIENPAFCDDPLGLLGNDAEDIRKAI